MAQIGIYLIMEREMTDVASLVAAEAVHCLDCGETYSKPSDGGTVRENPGCPRCGYLGWTGASIPLMNAEPGRLRYDAGPLRPRVARAH